MYFIVLSLLNGLNNSQDDAAWEKWTFCLCGNSYCSDMALSLLTDHFLNILPGKIFIFLKLTPFSINARIYLSYIYFVYGRHKKLFLNFFLYVCVLFGENFLCSRNMRQKMWRKKFIVVEGKFSSKIKRKNKHKLRSLKDLNQLSFYISNN